MEMMSITRLRTDRIRVLVVDDSHVARMFLTHVLERDPAIQVVGSVESGQAAVEFVRGTLPDVVLMDVHMPNMNGFEATRRIMESYPVPIVICSATANLLDTDSMFRSMEAGAVACVEKPTTLGQPLASTITARMVSTIKLMSEVRVVRRWPRSRMMTPARVHIAPASRVRAVGIGTSTGGPPALQQILSGLPKDFRVPILIVQHIAEGFLPGLVEWLSRSTPLTVKIAVDGTTPRPGHVYLAPDCRQMGLTANGDLSVRDLPADEGLRPAVSFLFRALAELYGAQAIGVLLTGMGHDGALELKQMKDRGAVTIAQDRQSSIVHGMPGTAISLGGATHVLPADQIADALVTLTNHRHVTDS